MLVKTSLQNLVIEALEFFGGTANILQICKYVWSNYEDDLVNSGHLFFTWQYDIRWAATELRKNGIVKEAWQS